MAGLFMRVITAALGTETNTFSPIPAGRQSFAETLLTMNDGSFVSDNAFAEPLHVWRRRAGELGDELYKGLTALPQPGCKTE